MSFGGIFNSRRNGLTRYIYNMRKSIIILLFLLIQIPVSAQVLGLLKYDGGGDWYSNPTALNNLSNYYNKATKANTYVFPQEVTVEALLSSGISFLHATGHGRIEFTESQRSILRLFVKRGGFIHMDDNYGMKDYAEKQLDLCFPDAIKEDVSHSHEIFNSVFPLKGLPKIHEHDNETPRAIGYFINGELIALLTIESDIETAGKMKKSIMIQRKKRESTKNGLKLGTLVHSKRLNHAEL